MTQPRKDFLGSLFQRHSKNKASSDNKTANVPVKTLAELKDVIAAGDYSRHDSFYANKENFFRRKQQDHHNTIIPWAAWKK